ncbi:MAG: permease, partial [Clostridia bacterium]|nr:permease [Clostridia bacterium]
TPGLAAAIEATGSDMASIGYGIAYPFGVVGVVLFVQLIPKLLKIDIGAERERLAAAASQEEAASPLKEKKVKNLDEFGMLPFALAVVIGMLIAKITIPLPGGASFSLGTSGGPLLAGLIFGHFGSIGGISISVKKSTLEVMREVGLALFLMGAGTQAGKGFVEVLKEQGVILFLLGALMTIVPMIIGYILARKIFKIDILTSLGAICGGMTSTPALGTLITMTKAEAVAISYAATYPVALIFVVLACQFLPLIVG